MPPELRNRHADNLLISIADSFGTYWGEAARSAALALTRRYYGEDAGVTLLRDIRDIFDARRVDRLTSVEMVSALNEIEDALWSEWRGIRDDDPPRRLSRVELARLLARFDIRPKSIWPVPRRRQSKSHKGYSRPQFEDAWRSYCSTSGTAAQPDNIRHLRGARN